MTTDSMTAKPVANPVEGTASEVTAESTVVEVSAPEVIASEVTVTPRKQLSVGDLRRQLKDQRGPELWRSLEELASTDDFQQMVDREFPESAIDWSDGFSRRGFLQVMGASLAFGGLAACTRQPLEKIVPYVEQPEQIVPGKPLYFATAMTTDGFAQGLLVESHMGRPTKVEGNPEHPANLGATDLFAQASILDLYDPDRLRNVQELGRIRSWSTFVDESSRAMVALDALGGARLRILTPTVTSPTLAGVVAEVLESHPKAQWHQYEAVGQNAQRVATQAVFGESVGIRHDFAKADVVLALDADFLTQGPGAVRASKDFMSRRRPGSASPGGIRKEGVKMNRLWALESTPTGTGSVADHRYAATPSEIGMFALALAAELGVAGATAGEVTSELEPVVQAVAENLRADAGNAVVLAGAATSPDLHILAAAINEVLGNLGNTVLISDAIEASTVDGLASIRELADAMKAGEVDVLVVLGGNPAYDAPVDLDFGSLMLGVTRRIFLGSQRNETAEYCQWVIPEAHYLECWGDSRSLDGTLTLQQPLIEPLYGGKSAGEVASVFTAAGERSSEELLKANWQAQYGDQYGDQPGEDDKAWRRALHDGYVTDSQAAAKSVAVDPAAVSQASANTAAVEGIELSLRADPTIWDGRWANNGWLQECPKPISKLTWDNALMISPGLAEEHGLKSGDLVTVSTGGRNLEVAALIHPGQAHNCATLTLGYGRQSAGKVGTERGFNGYLLRTVEAPNGGAAELAKAEGNYALASTQLHSNIDPSPWQGENLEGRTAEKRHLVRRATLAEYQHQPDFAQHVGHGIDENLSLMPDWEYNGHAWGMSIDLNSCTGCNACVVACQSENNIPVVGKEQVSLGREMHWMRIDRYYEGDLDHPEMHHQPVMCQHCEQAPCEVVCPVSATVHSDEGLNDMVYNRCVGTRYCANNCPYKVRRFNYYKYNDTDTPVLKLMRNPDVTVRFRGVMEKCSYCVQRINHGRVEATRDGREMADGDVKTACQQVCPSEAIVFGDINDPLSDVAQLKADSRDYGLLAELGTRPRTTYLAKVTNPVEGAESS